MHCGWCRSGVSDSAIFSFREIHEALGFGIYSFLLVAGTQLIFQTSTVIVGARLGPTHAAFYSIPTGLILQFLGILLGIAQVVMPVATQLHETGRRAELIELLHRWTKIAVGLTFLCAAGLILIGPDLIRLWLGPSMAPAATVLQLSIFALLIFLPARGAAAPVLMGVNRMARMTQAIFAAGIANALICYAIVGYFGVEGAAIANILTCWSLGLTILFLACRALDISVTDFLLETCLKPAIGLGLILASGFAIKSSATPIGLVGFMVGCVSILTAFGLVWYFFVLRNDRHITLPSFHVISQSFRRKAA
ncbi:MAG: oligosaccharide flippase family protein [Hyphomicrobiaceae bacterium]